MKKILVILAAVALVPVAVRLLNRPSDAMDVMIDATTVTTYSESVLETAAAIKDPAQRSEFMAALSEVGLEEEILRSGSDLLKDLLAKCDGKTPREIIDMAWREREAKQEVREALSAGVRNPRLDGYNVRIIDGKEYLFPKPTEAELTRREIVNALREIETYRLHWKSTEGRAGGRDAGPSLEEIRDRYGWPAATGRTEGVEYFYLDNGRGACRYGGKVYTLESPELSGEGQFP